VLYWGDSRRGRALDHIIRIGGEGGRPYYTAPQHPRAAGDGRADMTVGRACGIRSNRHGGRGRLDGGGRERLQRLVTTYPTAQTRCIPPPRCVKLPFCCVFCTRAPALTFVPRRISSCARAGCSPRRAATLRWRNGFGTPPPLSTPAQPATYSLVHFIPLYRYRRLRQWAAPPGPSASIAPHFRHRALGRYLPEQCAKLLLFGWNQFCCASTATHLRGRYGTYLRHR